MIINNVRIIDFALSNLVSHTYILTIAYVYPVTNTLGQGSLSVTYRCPYARLIGTLSAVR